MLRRDLETQQHYAGLPKKERSSEQRARLASGRRQTQVGHASQGKGVRRIVPLSIMVCTDGAYTEDRSRWEEALKEYRAKICDDPEQDSGTQERRIKKKVEKMAIDC